MENMTSELSMNLNCSELFSWIKNGILYWYQLSAGVNFRDFADFFGVRESLTHKIALSLPLAKVCTREIELSKLSRLIEISIKNNQKWRQNKKVSRKLNTPKNSERLHSRKFILAKVVPTKVYTDKVSFVFQGSKRRFLYYSMFGHVGTLRKLRNFSVWVNCMLFCSFTCNSNSSMD